MRLTRPVLRARVTIAVAVVLALPAGTSAAAADVRSEAAAGAEVAAGAAATAVDGTGESAARTIDPVARCSPSEALLAEEDGGEDDAPRPTAILSHPATEPAAEGDTATVVTDYRAARVTESYYQASSDGGLTWQVSTARRIVGPGILTSHSTYVVGVDARRDGELRRLAVCYRDGRVEFSEPVALSVLPRQPELDKPLAHVNVLEGTEVTLSGTVGNTTFVPSASWQRSDDGVIWADVEGSASTTATPQLELGPVSPEMSGTRYRVVLDNGSPAGPWTSAPATLVVAWSFPGATGQAAPGRRAELRVHDPQRGHGGFMELTAPTGTRITAVRSDAPAVMPVGWNIPEDGRTAVSDRSSTWGGDGTAEATTAVTVWVTLEVEEDQAPGSLLADGGIRVTADGVVIAQSSLAVDVLGEPVVHGGPDDLRVLEEQDAVFTVQVGGLPEPELQWQSSPDGDTWTDLPGDTGTTLTLTAVTRDLDGSRYRVVLRNTAAPEGVASRAATLTVLKDRPVHVRITPRLQVVDRLPGAGPT